MSPNITIRTRTNILTGGPWNPALRVYAIVIGNMRSRPISDVRSLAYQASIHGVSGPPPPNDFQAQCQHGCWFFVPWHRWYIYYFEQVILSLAAEMPELEGEDLSTWALPYWNYADAAANKLPVEFASMQRWDGQPNPLFDSTRKTKVNGRTDVVDDRLAVPNPGVMTQPFTSPNPKTPTFGGTESGWQHLPGQGTGVTGGLESVPHNAVHNWVGGNMANVAKAALDPVFWLHHCNIDRYWEMRDHQQDPTDWDNVPFWFRDPSNGSHEVVSGAGASTTALGYQYDDLTILPPPSPVIARRQERRMAMAADEGVAPGAVPEVVGTSDRVQLRGERVATSIAVGEPSSGFVDARAGLAGPSQVILNLDGVRATDDPGLSYAVYLGGEGDEHLAGVVAFFGLAEAAEQGHDHSYSFDVTDIVETMREAGRWNPDDVQVHFEPVGEPEDTIGDDQAIDVGAVSILLQ